MDRLSADEQQILESIVIASENDPNKPEFPPDNPRFPATPTVEILVPGFDRVLLKDESHNPTGTHKDRMAWEMVVTYRDFLIAKRDGQIEELPQMSIISSGSAAIAIQSRLKAHGLPALKVLVDSTLDKTTVDYLEKLGCEVFKTDLSRKPLSWREILALTNNETGIDITSSEALDPTTRFYDWLSYEILNSSPEYCFIPFGTGNLFENILNINKMEVGFEHGDPRFSGDREILRRCHFMGATTNDPDSKAEKLYSPHLPFVHYDEQWMRTYRYAGYCGNKSEVHVVREAFIDEALDVAAANEIEAEPSGIAGLALLLQLRDEIPRDAKILVVSTGKTQLV